VARLGLEIVPHRVLTPELVWQHASRTIEREQLRAWVAEADGEIVGYAEAGFEWSVPTAGKGRFWICVAPGRRGRGTGGGLYEQADGYLRGLGAWRLRTWVDDDPGGTRFLERRGFDPSGVDRVSELRLAGTELPEPEVPDGFRLVPLREARHLAHDLYEICAAGEIDMPGDEPETELTFEDWLQDDYGAPPLSDEGSFVALAGRTAVALAFLTVDPERRLAYNQMTATVPTLRRRGLALALKLASARWAAASGYERIVTENDVENEGMLAINQRIGYRPLYDQVGWVLDLRGS
jgi:GNAT superfamily N-acetyltransferase